MTEKRHAHRVVFDGSVEFEAGGNKQVCELFDISLKGALIGHCDNVAVVLDSDCTLTLNLDDDHGQQIVMQGSIAHISDDRIGIQNTSIDIDSMTHLRKLVEYNLGDSELLERDLAALIQ